MHQEIEGLPRIAGQNLYNRIMLEYIAFDADDTLWHTEYYYREAERAVLNVHRSHWQLLNETRLFVAPSARFIDWLHWRHRLFGRSLL